MRAASLEALEPLAVSILRKDNVLPENYDPAYFRAALAIVKEKIKLGRELPEWMGYFFREDFEFDPAAVKKVFTPDGLAHLGKLRERLASMDGPAKFSATESGKRIQGARRREPTRRLARYIHPARLAVFRAGRSGRASTICSKSWAKPATGRSTGWICVEKTAEKPLHTNQPWPTAPFPQRRVLPTLPGQPPLRRSICVSLTTSALTDRLRI